MRSRSGPWLARAVPSNWASNCAVATKDWRKLDLPHDFQVGVSLLRPLRRSDESFADDLGGIHDEGSKCRPSDGANGKWPRRRDRRFCGRGLDARPAEGADDAEQDRAPTKESSEQFGAGKQHALGHQG